MTFRFVLASLVLLLLPLGNANAVLTIEITEGIEGAMPIAIVPFGWEGPGRQPAVDVSAVVSSDLKRSGRFAPVPNQDLLARPHEGSEVDFKNWRMLGVDNLLLGKIQGTTTGGYVIQFQLFDVFKARQLTGLRIQANARNRDLRFAAHQISDIVYEALTGEPGAFNTRIAYITVTKQSTPQQKYALYVADADGYNPQVVLESRRELLSPAWSPDGRKLAYVSFEKNRPEIYVQDVESGKRELIASYPGHNGAPAWSPDGKKLALVLSQRRATDMSNFDIYVYDLRTKALRRLTKNLGNDTQPTWSPDGSTIAFMSDRGGSPQVYRMSASGVRPERLTFEGSDNQDPAFSPDGKMLAMVSTDKGKSRIAVLDLDTGLMRILTDGSLDESPSFAPNGSMIIYATNYNNMGVLSAVSVDGRVKQRIPSDVGNVREPAWSPFIHNGSNK
jgi:TolB protein